MPRQLLAVITAAICLAVLFPLLAQQASKQESLIAKAIREENYERADSLLKSDIAGFVSSRSLDTLLYYIPLVGKVAVKQSGAVKGSQVVLQMVELFKSNNASKELLIEANQEAAEFFGSIGQSQYGYDASKEALDLAMGLNPPAPLQVARCEYNLGTFADRLGNINLSQKHHRHAMEIRQQHKNASPEDRYLSANAMGALMWYGSKYDSAILFFNQALEALNTMPETDLNRHFRPGNVLNNMAAVFSAEGKTTEAINAMEECINHFQKFLDSKDPHPKKASATEGLFQGIDNLAGIYREIGDYGKGGELLRYSYTKKLQMLDPDHPGIFISEILLGQHYQGTHEYDSATFYLTKGLDKLEKTDGDYLFWAGDAYYNLAMVAENRKLNKEAAAYYKKSEDLYEQSFQGNYDNVYMDFLRSASLFYAKNNDFPAAVVRAEKVYNYLVNIGESASLQAFYQLLNIAEINYLTGRYNQAIEYSTNALSILEAKMKDGITLLDSVKMEVFKPKAILINARSAYVLQQNKDTIFLKSLIAKLAEASNVLQKRKVLIDDVSSINILMDDHQELNDFSKELQLKLYELTGNSAQLDLFVNLHESSLYNRIRARLDKQQAILFTRFPDSMSQQEIRLKSAITASLQQGEGRGERINAYLAALDNWESYLVKVKEEYPAYFNMRYATLFRPIREIQSDLPDSSTAIRYLNCNNKLMALVIEKNNTRLVPLDNQGLDEKISDLLRFSDEQHQLSLLHDLYKQLWQPVAGFVNTRRVIIIPDGMLFNLSFEMLAARPVTHYRELVSESLLSQHAISYHYSLFMLKHSGPEPVRKSNYVGFTPGFSDELKKSYLSVVKDSINLDQRYLTLLPQPGITKLARKIQGMLGGDIFMDEISTQSSFRKNAGGHSIIHIGTHAEYNNIHPEQSGLLFSKNISETGENNFLTLYDIYNCDMQSDLTLLTACESGKHGYQDGEGMISLAHAFNYAGSRRILTALWKVDEQASSQITESFIQNLKNGGATDEALRQAKLQYLENARGRTVAPAYWAGLVMMGEPSTLPLASANNYLWWIIGGALMLLVLSLIFIKKYQSRSI